MCAVPNTEAWPRIITEPTTRVTATNPSTITRAVTMPVWFAVKCGPRDLQDSRARDRRTLSRSSSPQPNPRSDRSSIAITRPRSLRPNRRISRTDHGCSPRLPILGKRLSPESLPQQRIGSHHLLPRHRNLRATLYIIVKRRGPTPSAPHIHRSLGRIVSIFTFPSKIVLGYWASGKGPSA